MMNEIHSALSRCSVLVRCRFLFGFRQQICDDQYILDKKKRKTQLILMIFRLKATKRPTALSGPKK